MSTASSSRSDTCETASSQHGLADTLAEDKRVEGTELAAVCAIPREKVNEQSHPAALDYSNKAKQILHENRLLRVLILIREPGMKRAIVNVVQSRAKESALPVPSAIQQDFTDGLGAVWLLVAGAAPAGFIGPMTKPADAGAQIPRHRRICRSAKHRAQIIRRRDNLTSGGRSVTQHARQRWGLMVLMPCQARLNYPRLVADRLGLAYSLSYACSAGARSLWSSGREGRVREEWVPKNY